MSNMQYWTTSDANDPERQPFDSNRVEAFFRDQMLRDLRADSIEFVSPVGCLADKNKTTIADCFKQWIDNSSSSRARH